MSLEVSGMECSGLHSRGSWIETVPKIRNITTNFSIPLNLWKPSSLEPCSSLIIEPMHAMFLGRDVASDPWSLSAWGLGRTQWRWGPTAWVRGALHTAVSSPGPLWWWLCELRAVDLLWDKNHKVEFPIPIEADALHSCTMQIYADVAPSGATCTNCQIQRFVPPRGDWVYLHQIPEAFCLKWVLLRPMQTAMQKHTTHGPMKN